MNRAACVVGILLQSLILGSLLFLAILEAAATATGARPFVYQGF